MDDIDIADRGTGYRRHLGLLRHRFGRLRCRYDRGGVRLRFFVFSFNIGERGDREPVARNLVVVGNVSISAKGDGRDERFLGILICCGRGRWCERGCGFVVFAVLVRVAGERVRSEKGSELGLEVVVHVTGGARRQRFDAFLGVGLGNSLGHEGRGREPDGKAGLEVVSLRPNVECRHGHGNRRLELSVVGEPWFANERGRGKEGGELIVFGYE